MKRNRGTLVYHMKKRRQELKNLLTDKKITSDDLIEFIKSYTEIDPNCSYIGPVPLPEEFSTMSATNLQILDNCGAVRASLNSWAIATWIENSIVKTFDNLKSTMECVAKLPLVPNTYNNFQTLVTVCFNFPFEISKSPSGFSPVKCSDFQLPRLGVGPYISRLEVDTKIIPKYESSQWIINNGPVRPWEAQYPIMTIPPVPIPLLGTSNM